jgi:hypothetical protein
VNDLDELLRRLDGLDLRMPTAFCSTRSRNSRVSWKLTSASSSTRRNLAKPFLDVAVREDAATAELRKNAETLSESSSNIEPGNVVEGSSNRKWELNFPQGLGSSDSREGVSRVVRRESLLL